ncbi:hypothetical protein D7V68_02110 [Acinetobacter cumulans]|nr:hypothetical protein D7V68_02110 [Acinetobacter cumulans]
MNIIKNPLILLITVLLFTFFIYAPGLNGDYVFDDSANILENQKLILEKLVFEELDRAWNSGDAGPLGRPISMLTFALNYYFVGSFEPYYFKLTNLFIHLFNGILLYFIALNFFSWLCVNKKEEIIKLMALTVCLIWLIHPLNLTSVLYVVQRMTSLSTLFGMLALLIYYHVRTINLTQLKKIFFIILMFFSLVLSVLSKESGFLFIGLIFLSELCVFKCKNIKNKPIYIANIKLIKLLWLVVVLLVLVLFFIANHFINIATTNRIFTIVERLYTESRVIFYYLKMFFVPLLSDLSLYHDDFEISKSIFKPITTLYSIIAMFFISLISLITYRKHPLFLFAWGWFIISHLMESTFISLELVHEHRNYFATIGFILVGVYYIFQIENKKIKPFFILLIAVYIGNLAFTTWQRSVIWSNLVDQAAYEVEMHPQSDRANYQMARMYMKLMINQPKDAVIYANKAKDYLARARSSYMPENGAWFAEIQLRYHLKEKVDDILIYELIDNLKNKPFYNSNLSFIYQFSKCQINGFCKMDHNLAVKILASGLDNPRVGEGLKSELYKILGQYFVEVAGDFIKGEEFLLLALSHNNDVSGNLLISQIYRLENQPLLARKYLEIAETLDTNYAWKTEIAIEKRNINKALFLKGISSSED